MKVVTIVGARPQFVKAAVVSQALRRSGIAEVLVHTGQHYDEKMSDTFFCDLEISPPQYNLAVGSCSHGAMTGRMLEGIEQVLLKEKPDWVVVFGDTNSTIAGALAAAKLHISVAHVEAGLRSDNRLMPEEINRVLVDHCSNLLLTPTRDATERLRTEGVAENTVVEVGDVMVDAARVFAPKARTSSTSLSKLGLPDGEFTLLTLHRAENTDSVARMNSILEGIKLAAEHAPVVWPMHPRVRAVLDQRGVELSDIRNLIVCEPVGYLDMLQLLSACKLVMTDSGGLQKEAYLFSRPCVTLRDETEWVELCHAGCNLLVGSSACAIVSGVKAMCERIIDWPEALYGDGYAADRIVTELQARYSQLFCG